MLAYGDALAGNLFVLGTRASLVRAAGVAWGGHSLSVLGLSGGCVFLFSVQARRLSETFRLFSGECGRFWSVCWLFLIPCLLLA
jgi:hypothetical protein